MTSSPCAPPTFTNHQVSFDQVSQTSIDFINQVDIHHGHKDPSDLDLIPTLCTLGPWAGPRASPWSWQWWSMICDKYSWFAFIRLGSWGFVMVHDHGRVFKPQHGLQCERLCPMWTPNLIIFSLTWVARWSEGQSPKHLYQSLTLVG